MREKFAYNRYDLSIKPFAKAALGAVIAAAVPHPSISEEQSKHTLLQNTAQITRMNDEGDFLVSQPSLYNIRAENIVIGEGEIYMVSRGCKIADIKKVNGGDIVRVKNPDECLPETK
jgi:hypothetical protein